MTTAVATSPALTALDRCDRCGAQAYVRVVLASGGELLFCAHHAREHASSLTRVADTVHDDSGTWSAILEDLSTESASAPDEDGGPQTA